MLVRPLRAQDMDTAMIMMDYYREEMELLEDEWDENSVIQSIKMYASNAESCFLIAVEGTRVVGCCSGVARKEFYNSTIETVCQMIYLIPSHRSEENYRQLFGEFLNWSVKFKSEKILLVDVGNSTTRIQPVADILDFDAKNIRFYCKEIA